MIRVYGEACPDAWKRLFERLATIVFAQLGLVGDAFLDVTTVDREQMRTLNARWRGIDRETDVLSFPAQNKILPFCRENYPFDFSEEGVPLGDIAVCEEIARAQAEEYGHSTSREMGYLFLHGLLHVLGYDHVNQEDGRTMRATEEAVLREANLLRESEGEAKEV